LLPVPENTSAPKLRIEGTQIPTKIPCDSEPLNQRKTDRKNDIAAAAKIEPLATFIRRLITINLNLVQIFIQNFNKFQLIPGHYRLI